MGFETPKFEEQEQERNADKYSSAKKYLEKWIDSLKINLVREKIQGKEEDVEDTQQALDRLSEKVCDLDHNNGGSTVEILEKYYPNDMEKGDLKEWRKAIFETSNETFTHNHFMKFEEIGEFFNDEYGDKLNKLDDDRTLSKEDRRNEWERIKKWTDVANELMDGDYKNALELIEEEIRNISGIIRNNREALKEEGRIKNYSNNSVEYQKSYIQTIDEFSKKLGKMRRVRDSLYAIEFKK